MAKQDEHETVLKCYLSLCQKASRNKKAKELLHKRMMELINRPKRRTK
jgi:hypothetical protein